MATSRETSPEESSFCSTRLPQSYLRSKSQLHEHHDEHDKTKNDILQHDDDQPTFFVNLVNRFQGDFDNYIQAQYDVDNNFTPGSGGGHEHIHASIVPLSTFTKNMLLEYFRQHEIDMYGSNVVCKNTHFVLAAYYVDGIPSKIFRFRLYSLESVPNNNANGNGNTEDCDVLLKIYSLDRKLLEIFKTSASTPTKWDSKLNEFMCSKRESEKKKSEDAADSLPLFTYIEGTDVLWTRGYNLERHSYLFDKDEKENLNNIEPSEGFHATMMNNEGAILNSTMNPGKKILIKDELSLWEDELWVNDRGFDLDSGDFVYGNRRGIPYKMDRVSHFVTENPNLSINDDESGSDRENKGVVWKRVLLKNDRSKQLHWTMGDNGEKNNMFVGMKQNKTCTCIDS